MKKQAATIDQLVEIFIGASVIVYTTETETREMDDGEVAEGKLAYAGHLLGVDSKFLLLGNIDAEGEAEPVVLINLDSVVSLREYTSSENNIEFKDIAGGSSKNDVN